MPETPLFTAYSLPVRRRPQGPATALSVLAHVAIAVLVLWRGAALLAGGGGGTGPRGGGGGGGRPVVTWFTIPAASAARALDVPAPPAVTVPTVALPDPVTIDVPPMEAIAPPPAAAATGTSTGTSGGPGQGPGSGGGQGAGTGPGRGNDVGPGSGGDAGYIPADVRGLIVPPDCARGEYLVRFWVEADGRVSHVEVTPPPKDAGCRRDMLTQMRAYTFRPATRDGQRVASVFPIRLVH